MQWLIDMAIEAMKAWYALYGGFHNRGDPAAADLLFAGMTDDDNWHDWDLSGIVPVNAKAVLLEIWLYNTAEEKTISIRTDGNANTFNVKHLATQVAGISKWGEGVVPLPASRIVEYKISAGGWFDIHLTVKGWWF